MASLLEKIQMMNKDNEDLRKALDLIKIHITYEQKKQNRDLSDAVDLIVDVARRHDLLLK